jgi:hypothetical protein
MKKKEPYTINKELKEKKRQLRHTQACIEQEKNNM